ncbi:hypothetical protein QBC37DRAFT_164662 [Rhypophila decipiens]|uniref:Apple domain-containing protein n=1 Tax=Rhypophila decipiens TaxID=261697 RepID=A0AAN6YHR4_9PEZI|nr:hypothetical protein QBC37DRAFT_164662 [Rhypophila decipiens]
MESRQHQGSSSQSLPNNNSRVRFAEEDPGLEAVQSQQPILKSREDIPPGAVVAQSSSAPEVYWADDRENEANLSQYTFLREPTPPPPDYDERHRKEYGYAAAVSGGRASRMEDGRAYPADGHGDDWSSTSSTRVVCGIRKRAFWIIIAVVVLFFIALALGVGLGVGLTKGNAPPTPTSTSSSSSATSPSPDSNGDSSPSTSTPTRPASPSGTSTPNTLLACPAANNTLYTTTTKDDVKKTFLRVCGVDYSGAGGAKDLRHVSTSTMAECMDACAELSGCTGAGWGHIAGDTGSKHRCWLKTDLQTPHKAIMDWDFAILQLQTELQP